MTTSPPPTTNLRYSERQLYREASLKGTHPWPEVKTLLERLGRERTALKEIADQLAAERTKPR